MIMKMMIALYNKLKTTHPNPLRRWLTSLTDLWNKQNPISVREFLSTFQSKILKKTPHKTIYLSLSGAIPKTPFVPPQGS